MYNILVIDDDISSLEIFDLLSSFIKKCNFFNICDLSMIKDIIDNNFFDIIFLDIVLPETNGYEICKMLKEHQNTSDAYYIFMSSHKSKLTDRIKALDIGGNEFLVKPIDIKELEINIKNKISFINKFNKTTGTSIVKKDFIFDQEFKNILIKGNKVELTNLEYKFLSFMYENKGKVLDTDQILRNIWGSTYTTSSDNLRGLIAKLRNKIEKDPQNPVYLINAKNKGYSLIV